MSSRSTDNVVPPMVETSATLRGQNWQQHPLGGVERWPATLRATVSFIADSGFPMMLWWGPELFQFYNDSFIPFLGAKKHPAAMGQRGADCWSEAWSVVGAEIEAVLRTGTAFWREDCCVPVSRNGRVEDAWWTYSYSPVRNDRAEVVGVLDIATETTRHVQATRRLQEATVALSAAQQELHRFLMQVPAGIAVLSGPHHVYTLVNPMFSAMGFGGRPASDFIGKPVREALPELRGQGYFEMLDGVYRTGRPFCAAKMRASLRQASGEDRTMFVNFTCQPHRDERGKVCGILAVLYEVTDAVNEQKEIEMLADRLRAALTSRDVFLGVASHELNTPLTSMMLHAQMFARQLRHDSSPAGGQERAEKFCNNVLGQARRLQRLVSDMLDVSRLAAGKLSLKRCDTDLSALLEDTLERFGPQLQAAGCTLRREVQAGVHAEVDAMRIDQVLSNILVNAIKYAPGAPLEASLRCEDGRAWLRLRDGGPGIPPEHHERVFGRFERATSASEVSGLGLGLYISAQIIADHGGEVTLQSAAGEGAAFTIELPATARALGAGRQA